ncbi:MAG: protein-disulfide reductase DsbD family protein [Alphaproteobacteria bacterium]|nr:protein-disulfide reductase DsbD family protein [Alphaproteobacteria bacterium]
MMRFLALLSVLCLWLPSLGLAQESPQHAVVSLISPVTATGDDMVVPLAVRVELEEGWKAYWRTPGESGLAPAFHWDGSENIESAHPVFPPPHRYVMAGIENFVYADEVIFPVDAVVSVPGAAVQARLKLDLLVCSDICIPETHVAALDLPAGERTPSTEADIYVTALQRIPQMHTGPYEFERLWLSYDRSNVNYLVVEFLSKTLPVEGADIFVEHESGLHFGAPYLSTTKNVTQDEVSKDYLTKLFVPIRSSMTLDDLEKELSASDLTLTYVSGDVAVEGRVKLSPRPDDAMAPLPPMGVETPARLDISIGIAHILLLAFAGGLILNLMPCVLPVLSLKILSVVQHGGAQAQRGKIFRNFMSSVAGILFSFWVMAGAIVFLKAAGQTVGWGIQFQHPAFLVFLIVVVLFFAFNMLGLFEIPLPRFIARNVPSEHAHEPTMTGHFLTGVFATLLATPCTAPFLGTAIGFALARAADDIFAIFTMIGIGLAAPYILLAFAPGAFRFLPKPGAWMVRLKQVLGLALVVTAFWLSGVLGTIMATPTLDTGWKAFDESLIMPAVADGRIVVVDVTADWCLTCKANKRLVLEQDDIAATLAQPEFLLLQADWTQRNEDIAAYLKKYGRYGIPFNVVYGPAAPEGIVLPELLTKKTVLQAVNAAAGE